MSDVTIYHNPSCGTSRNTLALLRHAGIEPVVIEYLKTPPGKERLHGLLAQMGMSVRDAAAPEGHALRRAEASTIRSGPTTICSTSCFAIRS